MLPDPGRAALLDPAIHVDDFAALVVEAIAYDESWTRDAAGPDRIEFSALIYLVTKLTGRRGRPSGFS